MAFLYWIHTKDQTDFKSEGYIGVTKQPVSRRFSQHKRDSLRNSLRRKGKTIPTLSKAFIKHGEALLVDTLVEADYEYVLELEALLRPSLRIGWNVCQGGGKPYEGKGGSRKEIMKDYYESNPHPATLKNPWEIPAAKNSQLLWAKADEVYLAWQEGKSETVTSRLVGCTSRSTTIRSMFKLFSQGWKPCDDGAWTENFKGVSSDNPC